MTYGTDLYNPQPVAKTANQAGADIAVVKDGFDPKKHVAACSGCTETETTWDKKQALEWARDHAKECTFTAA